MPDPAALLAFAAGTVALVGLLVTLEGLVRRRGWPHETTRRIAHVVACLYAMLVHATLPLALFAAVCAVFVVALVGSRRGGLLTAVHVTRRDSLGEVYLPVGIVIAALAGAWAPEGDRVFLASILVLALADVAAGATGDLLRSDRKTWWGSLAFLVVAAAVLLACGFAPIVVAVAALAATATERLSGRGTDNVTVPLVTGLVLVLLPA